MAPDQAYKTANFSMDNVLQKGFKQLLKLGIKTSALKHSFIQKREWYKNQAGAPR
ncbi:hypothetical protein GCM10007941_02310 [Amphritea balenae]|nr:hypothetical protein GCM10007941_02310 [Amphritea balenae]